MSVAPMQTEPPLDGNMPPSPATTSDPTPETTDVLVVGAGPAGLMLATSLARFGIPVKIIDERSTKTVTGRADGLQPKTLETLKQMRIIDPVLKKGAKIYDMSYWNSYPDKPLHRKSRECHFPPVVDVLEPFILLVHQGMVEGLFLDDMAAHGLAVDRSCTLDSYTVDETPGELHPVVARYGAPGGEKTIRAKYMVGCDGAHSNVRRSMPGAKMEGESVDALWGVLDGVINTDFPDLWSKCAIATHDKGAILCIPRERNMTRLYIELSTGSEGNTISKAIANEEFVMKRAKEIIAPFSLEWETVEWFGVYQIAQRISSHFSDRGKVFIAGDAGHTHSPKAAQGMNVSMHDTFNLGWKLALVLKGLSPQSLLDTYTLERRKVAQDLIAFDHEHAHAFIKNDQKALAENFRQNIRFISGVGANYDNNALNRKIGFSGCSLKPGELLLPARATRYIDANPIDIQLDIPLLGQFRVYFLTANYNSTKPLLDDICIGIASPSSIISRASVASASSPLRAPKVESDEFTQPQRYLLERTQLFTFGLITQTPQAELEFTDLPKLLQGYRWTFYNDNLDKGVSPIVKWNEGQGLEEGELEVVCVRPDGYVGAIGKWGVGGAEDAKAWLESYFEGFLTA